MRWVLSQALQPQTLITKVKVAGLGEEAGCPSVPPQERVPPRPARRATLSLPPEPRRRSDAWATPTDRPAPEMVPPFHPKEGPTGLDEGFAIEAGERELSVSPGDQTVLLGGEDTASLPGEDIWADVQGTQEDVVPPAGRALAMRLRSSWLSP
jgi:hypothetical protein